MKKLLATLLLVLVFFTQFAMCEEAGLDLSAYGLSEVQQFSPNGTVVITLTDGSTITAIANTVLNGGTNDKPATFIYDIDTGYAYDLRNMASMEVLSTDEESNRIEWRFTDLSGAEETCITKCTYTKLRFIDVDYTKAYTDCAYNTIASIAFDYTTTPDVQLPMTLLVRADGTSGVLAPTASVLLQYDNYSSILYRSTLYTEHMDLIPFSTIESFSLVNDDSDVDVCFTMKNGATESDQFDSDVSLRGVYYLTSTAVYEENKADIGTIYIDIGME